MRAQGLVVVVLAGAEWCSAGTAADVCLREEPFTALLQMRMLRRAPDLDHEDADEERSAPDASPPHAEREDASPLHAEREDASPPHAEHLDVEHLDVEHLDVAAPTTAPAALLSAASSRTSAGTAPPASVVHVVLPPRNGTLSLTQAVEPAAPPAAPPPAPATAVAPATAAAVEQQLDHGQ